MESNYSNSQLANELDVTIDEQKIVSANKFIVLCIVTVGLYAIWWQYKTWRFFKQWQQSDIWPVARALFSVFNVYQLLKEVQRFASRNTPTAVDYNPGNLASSYIILTLLARLPDPFWLGSIAAFTFLLPAYKAFCAALLITKEIRVVEQTRFNARQLVLLIASGLSWSLVLIGLLMPE